MRKQFKSKRRIKLKYMFWFILFIITVGVNILCIDNVSYSSLILNKDNIFKFNFDKNKILLKLGLNYEPEEIDIPVFNELVDVDKEEKIIGKIYLYNTHQSEEYADTDVFTMAKEFKSILENKGFIVTLADMNITDYIKKNNLEYKDSYKVTRELVTDALKDEYDLYIDYHRDSTKKSGSTTTFDGKSYARVMFVIGSNHNNYQVNYNLVDNINKQIKNINNKLTRGIFVRKSSVYNQDLDPNVFLIEIGGPENTREEVNNTLMMLADVLEYYFTE